MGEGIASRRQGRDGHPLGGTPHTPDPPGSGRGGAIQATLGAWIRAARPLALTNILLPLLLGLAFGAQVKPGLDPLVWAAALAFGMLDQWFIVFANDFADADSDGENTTFNLFSGGSRMIPEGRLSRRAVGCAAVVAAVALLGLCAYLALAWQRWLLLPCWAAAVFLLWAYSYPPARLSYRGHGELLQALGLGLVLPIVGYHLQVGGWGLPRFGQLVTPLLLGYAGNILTALPDTPSDRACSKRTWPVRAGQLPARVVFLAVVALAALGIPNMLPPELPGAVWVPAGTWLMLVVSLLWLRSADAENPVQCRRFMTTGGAAIAWLLASASVVQLWG